MYNTGLHNEMKDCNYFILKNNSVMQFKKKQKIQRGDFNQHQQENDICFLSKTL